MHGKRADRQVLNDAGVRDEPVGDGGNPVLRYGAGNPRAGGADGHYGRSQWQ